MLTDQCVRHMVRRSYGAVEKGYVSLSPHQSPTHVSNINRLCEPVWNARQFLCLLCRTIAHSLRGDTPASASTPPGATVHKADRRLGLSIVNWLYQSVSVGLDGFICAVGWRLYVSLRRLPLQCMILLLNVDPSCLKTQIRAIWPSLSITKKRSYQHKRSKCRFTPKPPSFQTIRK